MARELAWKPENFDFRLTPHVVIKHVGEDAPDWVRDTYGVFVVTSSKGHTRPVGSGHGATLAGAIAAATEYNNRMRTSRDD